MRSICVVDLSVVFSILVAKFQSIIWMNYNLSTLPSDGHLSNLQLSAIKNKHINVVFINYTYIMFMNINIHAKFFV